MYTAIQDAVDAAAPGDTIRVRTGTYVEDIRISTNNLALVSADGPGLAVIEGAGTRDGVIQVDTDLGVTVDGFRFLPGPTGIWGVYHNGGALVIKPFFSNTGINCPGEISPRAGWFQRASASAP